jgi:hypothetical protein
LGVAILAAYCAGLIGCLSLDGYLLSMVARAPGPPPWTLLFRIIAFLAAMTVPFVLAVAWATLRLLRRPRLTRRIEMSPDRLVYTRGAVWRDRRREWTAPQQLYWRIDRGPEKPGRARLFCVSFGNINECFYDKRPDFGDQITAAFRRALESGAAAEHHSNA